MCTQTSIEEQENPKMNACHKWNGSVWINCLGNNPQGLTINSGDYVQISLDVDIDSVFVELNGQQLNYIVLETKDQTCENVRWEITDILFNNIFKYKKLSTSQHFFLREKSEKAKCMTFKFGTLDGVGTLNEMRFFKSCQKEIDMKKYVKEECKIRRKLYLGKT
ncbi:hypothetical protein TCAL_16147 [Tigriopus californicus]|uniref:Uncharacterized protein n=1 Tax=Tigriopus californicus TaxID=6832 RepID=A0A553P222_TIGCA|nr:hypothetical protein TCAL_16147 [Tigriopus californicus]